MSHDRGCPCGKEPYEYNDCTAKDCYKKERLPKMTIQNISKKYILIGENEPPIILEDEDVLIRSFNSNLRTESDRYYELGPEVKIKTTVQVVPTGTTYRHPSDASDIPRLTEPDPVLRWRR